MILLYIYIGQNDKRQITRHGVEKETWNIRKNSRMAKGGEEAVEGS